ncbi:neuromodulin [Topomyia yanbarensis]|uniref:neuromodulin n=1 Tax=Topomyia yanbarensis TaxID=2498891 RepID=UPI00273AA1C0|nr:neuromodulin [Topomyia yanbarensis]
MGCNTSQELPTYNSQIDSNNVDQRDELAEILDGDVEQVEAAATKIQAVFRGHQVRTKMKQEDVNGSQPQQNSGADGEREPTKQELEAEFDPNDEELTHAATRIQACFRGHMSRKDGTGKKDEGDDKKEEVDIDELTKKVAEELDIDMDDPELHKAASKIQASFRGHKVRKDVPVKTDGK